MVAIALIMGNHGVSLWWYAVLGAALGVLSQFGDLAASMVKRHFGVKDFGNLMPGHGGLMDRVDSTILFCPWYTCFQPGDWDLRGFAKTKRQAPLGFFI